MAESTGEVAQGVALLIAPIPVSPALPQFVEVANCVSVTLTGRERATIDFTHLRSTGGIREMRPGFASAGSLEFNCHFNPKTPSLVTLRQNYEQKKLFLWRLDLTTIELADPNAEDDWAVWIQGKGFITNPGNLNFELDAAIAQTMAMQNTGPVTFDDATP